MCASVFRPDVTLDFGEEYMTGHSAGVRMILFQALKGFDRC